MKILEYPELLTLTDNDYVLGVDGETQTTVKIKVSTIRDYLDIPEAPALPNLVFESVGDANDVIFWLASKDTNQWSNPHTNGKVIVIASAIGSGTLAAIVDRTLSGSNYTTNAQNSYWGVNLVSCKLKLTYYAIRHDGNVGYYARGWELQASNNGDDWVTLDSQSNNTQINTVGAWASISVSGITTAYKMFKVMMTRVNSSGTYEFCCTELTLYGQVVAL